MPTATTAFAADDDATLLDTAFVATVAASPTTVEKIKFYRVSFEDETGDCPACGCAPAYAYTVKGFEDGYFDACPKCAPEVAEDFIADAESPEPAEL